MTQQTNRQAIKTESVRDVGLTAEQLRTVRRVYSVVGPCLPSTLEEFESDFRRELFPEREIRIWSQIASAFARFRELHPSATNAELKLALQVLVLVSSGARGHSKVPATVWDELLQLYAPA